MRPLAGRADASPGSEVKGRSPGVAAGRGRLLVSPSSTSAGWPRRLNWGVRLLVCSRRCSLRWCRSLPSVTLPTGCRGLDASGWFLSAMTLRQLGQKKGARAALRKGVEWIDERKKKAEDNALLRLQYESMR